MPAASGQRGSQAAHLVMTGGGVGKLGTAFGSVAGQENDALDIVAGTTLAYRPTYNNDIGESRSCRPHRS
jgi:hypothetical protein